MIDIFTKEDYENVNLDYPEEYLEELLKVTEEKNKKLKEKIYKAIDYINKHSYDIHKVELLRFEIDELLEILEGE